MMAQLHCALRRASALVAVAWLSACSAPATRDSHDATATLDATVEDIGAPDVTRVRDADRARDAAVVDADAAVDGGLLALIPVDPVGGPPPGSECTSDASVRAGDPSIAPPRPILPQSVSRVTSQRPSFHWALPPGTTGARVEVCADRCCTRVITTLDAEGTTVRPGEALPPGVLFWRMFGRSVGVVGSRASYTWEFEVRRRDTPVDSSWGTIRDFTGDGYDDLLVFSGSHVTSNPASLFIVEGSPEGPRPPRSIAEVPMVNERQARVGDFNGDGLADLLYDSTRIELCSFIVLEGNSGGIRVARPIGAPTDAGVCFGGPAVTDWDGDGYSDLVVSSYLRVGLEVQESALMVFRGSPDGLHTYPQMAEVFRSPIPRAWVDTFRELDDVNGDGFGDVYAEAEFLGYIGSGRYVVHGSVDLHHTVEVIPDPPVSFGLHGYSGVAIPARLGDVDGDGRGDFSLTPLGLERVQVYFGRTWRSGTAMTITEPRDAGGVVMGGGYGEYVEAGDVNGDGLSDLLISASLSFTETVPGTDFPFNSGRMYVYLGQADGGVADPIWIDHQRPDDYHDLAAQFASFVASPGDLDADGFDDAAVVDPGRRQVCYLFGERAIGVRHLLGCPEYPDPSPIAL